MIPIDIDALISKINAIGRKRKLYHFIHLARACNGYMEIADIGLNLDISDIVKQKPANARKALDKILRIVSDEVDRQSSFLAVQLLDCLMVNCGYSVRFYMTRKEYLNLLVKRFPPSPSFQLDHAMKRTLKLIKKWKLSLCDKSRFKSDFSNVILMHDLLISKNYIFPPIASEEIDAMVGLELQTLRTKESLQEDEKSVLETKLEYYLWKGGPSDIKRANEIMKQMIESQDPFKYSTADSQIMQDLQKLEDKLVLLEDLVKNNQEEEGQEDSKSLLGLLNNPIISQMYRACRDEIPKLLQLANSNLNEDLMNRIINITERLTVIKNIVEIPVSTEFTEKSKFELKQSTDEIKNIFDDLPQLTSPNPTDSETETETQAYNDNYLNIERLEFKFNNDLLADLVQISETKRVLRVMNISSTGNDLLDLKLVTDSQRDYITNGKLLTKRLGPMQCFVRSIDPDHEIIVNYNGNQRLSIKKSSLKQKQIHNLSDGIENLLLI